MTESAGRGVPPARLGGDLGSPRRTGGRERRRTGSAEGRDRVYRVHTEAAPEASRKNAICEGPEAAGRRAVDTAAGPRPSCCAASAAGTPGGCSFRRAVGSARTPAPRFLGLTGGRRAA